MGLAESSGRALRTPQAALPLRGPRRGGGTRGATWIAVALDQVRGASRKTVSPDFADFARGAGKEP